jgi:uncharacterized phosphosugar-binding protein
MASLTDDVRAYAAAALPELSSLLDRNAEAIERIVASLGSDVGQGRSLFVFGSGHCSIFPMELYHRAGGASFVVPIVGDFLLPTAGPPVVRVLERTPGLALSLLNRAAPNSGETLWVASQSGINAAGVDLALAAKERGLRTVAFTSVAHSRSMSSRHPSGKRLFEVCHETVDLGGVPGDALVSVGPNLTAGPFSTLSLVFLGHTILVAACARLENAGTRCVYVSVNTSEGEARNRAIEEIAKRRDPLLR